MLCKSRIMGDFESKVVVVVKGHKYNVTRFIAAKKLSRDPRHFDLSE